MNKYMSFDELKEELGKDYDKKLYEIGLSALKEIERLNNIINELEKWLEFELLYDTKNDINARYILETSLDKLKELKEKV